MSETKRDDGGAASPWAKTAHDLLDEYSETVGEKDSILCCIVEADLAVLEEIVKLAVESRRRSAQAGGE